MLLLFFLVCGGELGLAGELHTFTDTQGRLLKAELVSILGDQVTIKRDDGQVFTVKASTFSQADQDWLKQRGMPKDATLPPDEVVGLDTTKLMELVLSGDSPSWGYVWRRKAAFHEPRNAAPETTKPDDVVLTYQKANHSNEGAGILIYSQFYPYWDEPEKCPIKGIGFEKRLHDMDYRRAEAARIDALKDACQAKGIPLYIRLDFGSNHFRVLVALQKSGPGIVR